jgi:hypothetical protein
MKINVDLIYPIGAIYMSVNSTNPSVLFGGTWAVWSIGRVPVGIDANDSDFNSPEKIGGSKYIQQHTHNMTYGDYGNNGGGIGCASNTSSSGAPVYSGNVRGVQTGNSGNLQPYIVCYMWKRTA